MENLYNLIMDIVGSVSVLGVFITSFLIVFESIIPPLPLGVFITVFFMNYGKVIGFFMSYILTIIGCSLSYFIFSKYVKKKTDKYLRKYKKIDKYIALVDNIKFSTLVLILSIPFTPAFLVNIACGISKMKYKKFLYSIMLGKISLVLFYGFIGTSLVESIKRPMILVFVAITTLVFYILSKIVNRKLKID
jgi:uncharacterized membrane protein YdjX (TVP38/TMEM64 family)